MRAAGGGKSTIAAALAAGGRAAVLSLDDLYLGPAARARLAATVDPLLATRGVPGTHDVALGRAVLAKLVARKPVALPRFDKATDAPRPVADVVDVGVVGLPAAAGVLAVDVAGDDGAGHVQRWPVGL